ncbi:1-acyl-sn-glycerol-3-phosphate acyltransferase [Reinekea sp.]|uniref:1-acyl-sn-glycerol-3-phosphate acyltransferase n=1 Tax=Reinekea sp. TaxID=1970455 RepID=UPI002A82DD0F|nr:1-acyl-sn-glycerol-3-phosphate acyltransferase [Reinekea sp.]
MFGNIRPFQDAEVKPVLKSTLNDPALAKALGSWFAPGLNKKVPWMLHPLIRLVLKVYLCSVIDVAGFQQKLRPLISRLLKKSVAEFSVHGLERLDKQKAYLFVSNHRDIVMDPAMLNWALHQNGFQTARIAVGDNLLTQPFSANLMRLNKSFIVKRSVTGLKARLKAAQELSRYIHYSILEETASIWIAQRAGRSKDGYDRTNPAVIGMFSLSKPTLHGYSDYINELNIVPVAISYELDPLDLAKARELYATDTKGAYVKRKNEDLHAIARGMTGWKGRVHLEFGEVLQGQFETDDDVAEQIDGQIHQLYQSFPTNAWAEASLNNEVAEIANASVETLKNRVESARAELRPYILKQYANGLRMRRGEAPL